MLVLSPAGNIGSPAIRITLKSIPDLLKDDRFSLADVIDTWFSKTPDAIKLKDLGA